MEYIDMYGILVVVQFLVAIRLVRKTKKYLTTKEEYDIIKERDRLANNREVFLDARHVKLNDLEIELKSKHERLQVQEKELETKRMIDDISDGRLVLGLKHSAFYDVENETVVLMENLYRIGEK